MNKADDLLSDVIAAICKSRPNVAAMAIVFVVSLAGVACSSADAGDEQNGQTEASGSNAAMESEAIDSLDDFEVAPAEPTFELSDEEWRERLTEEEYYILRQEGTEPAFTGELLGNERDGVYHCAGCDHPLFSSETRFDSGTGWPSFTAPIEGAVGTKYDNSLNMQRIEVHCGRCAGHLGHVFADGPEPTGLRYCINSLALNFEEAQ